MKAVRAMPKTQYPWIPLPFERRQGSCRSRLRESNLESALFLRGSQTHSAKQRCVPITLASAMFSGDIVNQHFQPLLRQAMSPFPVSPQRLTFLIGPTAKHKVKRAERWAYSSRVEQEPALIRRETPEASGLVPVIRNPPVTLLKIVHDCHGRWILA